MFAPGDPTILWRITKSPITGKSFIERRSVTSRYHGSKIFGSHQGSLSNDDGDGNENGKKAIGLY